MHGGPGAPVEMAPVARELSAQHAIMEPLQTADSLEGQVKEPAALLASQGLAPFGLVGWLWGAWLTFIYAARFPDRVDKLILVGAPPFDEKLVP